VRFDKKAVELAVLIALFFAMAFVGPKRSHASQVDRIQIIDASRDDGTSERRNIGQPFDETNRCSEKRRVAKIADLLGADVTALHVQRYDKAWSNITVVAEYIRRIMTAEPETRELSPFSNWSEWKPVEIEGTVAFRSGEKSRIEFANGYAHVADASGCEWWGRYLGADRTKWIVR
jgi:hypothetical protein